MAEKIQNTLSFNRPPRIQDSFRTVELDIPAPPTPAEEPARNLLLMILPMGSFLVMGLFYALAFRGGGSGVSGWLYALPMIAMSIFTFASSFVMYGEQKHEQKKKWIKQLRDYHRMLDKKESRLLAGRNLQTDLLFTRFPSPDEVIRRVKDLEINLWERRKEDPDFLALRVGLGNAHSQVGIKSPDPDMISAEIRRAFGLYTEYRFIPDSPVHIDLQELSSVAIVGNRGNTIPLARAFLAQVAALNSPDDVQIYLFSSESYYRTWKWLRWLPHTSQSHTGGQPNFLVFDPGENKKLIAQISQEIDAALQTTEEKSDPVLPATAFLMVFDNESGVRDEPVFDRFMKSGNTLNAFSIVICDSIEDVPSECQALIEVNKSSFTFSKVGADGIKLSGTFDRVSFVDADNLAHRLIPISIRSLGQGNRIPSKVNLLQVYQAASIEQLQIAGRWQRIPDENGLLPFPIPVGRETSMTPLVIHLAENHDGPHGLIAGTTGSGKSELLQMLVSALAIEHHPYLVNFLLIDFKGASTFGVFENLPHTVGLVSNLDKVSALRALEAIKAENIRRQIFLREQGVEDIIEYHKKLCHIGKIVKTWNPLPHLFIVVDEFAQMAQDMPGFLPELVATVRVGRSLGLHLILATQRPAGVVNDEMRANLNFRISLRVQTIDDSRDMLRRPDAAFLPHNLPGRAYFQLGDGGTPRLFQVARAGVDYDDLSEQSKFQANQVYRISNEKYELVTEELTTGENGQKEEKSTITKVLVDRMKGQYQLSPCRKMDKILLPPLPDNLPIGKLIQDDKDYMRWDDETREWRERSERTDFRVPIGIIDSLATRSQPAWWLDFLQFGGHVMAVGGPQSGKTLFLQTLAHNLATGYAPSEVNIYVLSFAGREMEVIQELPHVGSVIQGSETEKFHRLLRYLQNQVIEVRKREFARQKAKDLREYNSQVPVEKRLPYICVMIDNFGELRNPEYDDELTEVQQLIQNGRMYGVHFVITALQGSDIPYKITNLIQQRLAFNIPDHNDYILLVGRPESLDFDTLPKGRAFVSGTPPMQCQIAHPPYKEEWERLSMRMDAAWANRPRPHEIKILEPSVFLSKVLETRRDSESTLSGLVGIDGDSLLPFELDFKRSGPHFLVGGPSQSGRTSVLHTAVLSLAYEFSPEKLWIVLMDGANGSLRELAELPHVIDWVNEEVGLARNIACLQGELKYRRGLLTDSKTSKKKNPGPLFPEMLFVIDDYDLTCEALAINDIILTKLGKNIRQDSDLGFHLLLSVLPDNLQGGGDPLIKQMRLARTGISLSNIDTLEMLGGRSTVAMRREDLTQGRGYFLSRSGSCLVQFALPDAPVYGTVLKKWADFSRAKWPHPAAKEDINKVLEDSAPDVTKKAEPGGDIPARSLIDINESVKRYIEQQQRVKKKGGN